MSLPVPITIAQEVELIEAQLNVFCQARGGTVGVMASMSHLWEEALKVTSSDVPRILICFTGETARGGFNQANTLHRVDRQWIVVVLRGHGFTGSTNPTQFYDDVEDVREGLRMMLDISEEFPIDYKSMKALPNPSGMGRNGNVFLDGYGIEFSTANDIPAIIKT